MKRALAVGKVLFVILVFAFGLWGIIRNWSAISEAALQIPAWRLALSLAATTVGVITLGPVWKRVLTRFGHEIGGRPAYAAFFVGQLGKYIPGGVWSLAAQASMTSRYSVPARTTVVTGLLLIMSQLATASIAAAGWLALTLPEPWNFLTALAAVGVGLALITPPIINRIGARLAGAPLSMRNYDTGITVLLLMVGWISLGAAVALLIPSPLGLTDYTYITGLFATAFLLGIVMIFAPAGVGVREATLIAGLTPLVGLDAAIVAALLSRVFATLVDFAVAGGAWALARNTRQGALT